jgi:hypothetical protein
MATQLGRPALLLDRSGRNQTGPDERNSRFLAVPEHASAFGLDSNRLFAIVVGQENNEIDYFSVIGGPVALPQRAANLSVAPDGALMRTDNIFSVVLQIADLGGTPANDVTITSVTPMAPVTYLGSLLPVNLAQFRPAQRLT